MDENEFDIYDDLDVFDDNKKRVEETTKLDEELKDIQLKLQRLKDENANLQRINEVTERNCSSLLMTAKAEIKRKDEQIHELRKEKDNIVFRRTKLPKKIQTQNAFTQTHISCKPLLSYELKGIEDDAREKSVERLKRRGENRVNNAPISKADESKVSQKPRESDKGAANQRLRHQELRAKQNNRRREDERRDQLFPERPKRRRSRSASKDRKRPRRSRSRSRERRRDRNHERKSPEKPSRNPVILASVVER